MAVHDLLGQIGSGEDPVRPSRESLLDDLGHAQQRALLETLGEADDGNPGPDEGAELFAAGAKTVRGNTDHDTDQSGTQRFVMIRRKTR